MRQQKCIRRRRLGRGHPFGTRAILPVHLYGQMCDMDAIGCIADKHGLAVIEDAAQAVGATRRGKKAGSFGTGCFSLYATKNIMSAEGGMVTSDDDAIAEKVRLLRNHGMKRRYYHDILGYNFRMTDLHAAIGLAQVNRLDDFTAQRRANAEYLSAHIKTAITPKVMPGNAHVWHQYTIRVDGKNRAAAAKQLNDAGIGTGIFYPIPVHRQEFVRQIVGDVSLPVTEQLAAEVISLPVHPQLSPQDVQKIAAEVNKL